MQTFSSSSTSGREYLVSQYLASFAKFQRNVSSEYKFPTKYEERCVIQTQLGEHYERVIGGEAGDEDFGG